MSRDESLPSNHESMDFTLMPAAAETVRDLVTELGYSPEVLVKMGLGLVALWHDARRKGYRVAVVTEEGVPLNEVVLPESKMIGETVRKILEQASPSSALERVIADHCDPERPGYRDQSGPSR